MGKLSPQNPKKSECLNKFFHSVFTTNDGKLPNFVPKPNLNTIFTDIVFSDALILKSLLHISNSRACGTDKIPNIFLKKCAHVLVRPLRFLFNNIFSMGVLPKSWLEANIVPIFKEKGAKTNPKNYRPISLTSSVCRVMELCIKNCF